MQILMWGKVYQCLEGKSTQIIYQELAIGQQDNYLKSVKWATAADRTAFKWCKGLCDLPVQEWWNNQLPPLTATRYCESLKIWTGHVPMCSWCSHLFARWSYKWNSYFTSSEWYQKSLKDFLHCCITDMESTFRKR